MVFFNYATMQMAAKVVYYGPGLCGKTTNLHHIYGRTAPGSRGEMVSLETETDRTLFFDLLPLDVGVIGGFKTRVQLYTVPGQVFYNTTRKLVLKGVDGIVFVADSQRAMKEANVESLANLKTNLAEIGVKLDEIPLVLQYNKRDLANILSLEELEESLNPAKLYESYEACAVLGQGVFETLKAISRLTLRSLKKRMLGERRPGRARQRRRGTEAAPAAAAEPPPAPRPAPARAAASRRRPTICRRRSTSTPAPSRRAAPVVAQALRAQSAAGERSTRPTSRRCRSSSRPSIRSTRRCRRPGRSRRPGSAVAAGSARSPTSPSPRRRSPSRRRRSSRKSATSRSARTSTSSRSSSGSGRRRPPDPRSARRRSPADPATGISVDDLLASSLNHRKEVSKVFEMQVPRRQLSQGHQVTVGLRFEDTTGQGDRRTPDRSRSSSSRAATSRSSCCR